MAHRYWKWRFPDTHIAGEYLGIAELEARATVGGADQTTGKTITASATAGAPYLPTSATDNNNATFFTTGATAPPVGGHWLKVDFGAGTPVDVEQTLIRVRPDGFREDPMQMIVEWSDDDITYTPYYAVSGIAAWAAGEARTFSAVDYNILKISKATLQVASFESTMLSIYKATLQVASIPGAASSGRRRMALG